MKKRKSSFFRRHLKKKNLGDFAFTLIELLLVVSIIGLLSSVTAASMKGSREKAENAKIIENIHQYRNALELYNSTNNTYPAFQGPAVMVCMGTGYPNGQCGFDNNPTYESGGMNAALAPYIKLVPPSTKSLKYGLNEFVGLQYVCPIVDHNVCERFELEWMLNGTVTKCGNNGVVQGTNINTYCKASLP